MPSDKTRKLRSQEWWTGGDYYSFSRKAWLRSEGYTRDVFENRPVIGICNSWSELNNCNAHLRTVAEAVKRGVWRAGGFPLEFPTISLGEMFLKPTSMLFRNLMSMDVEEMITFFNISGCMYYVDEEGRHTGFEDVFTKIDMCRKHYEACGLGADYVNRFVR